MGMRLESKREKWVGEGGGGRWGMRKGNREWGVVEDLGRLVA